MMSRQTIVPWDMYSRMDADRLGITTNRPTHVRITAQDGGWLIQGADDDGRPTWAHWWFSDFDDAWAYIETFVEETACYGLVWAWRETEQQEVTA